jgi:hypothetical protein
VRPRTRNEKVLLALLVTILFLTGNWYAYKWFAAKQSALHATAVDLQDAQDSATTALQEIPTWQQRKAWVNDKEPPLGDEGEAKAAVLESVQKGARANKLEIVEQSLNDVQPGAGGARVNVSLKVKGSMQDLVNWLTALEKPDDFYAVTLFSLKADTDQKSFDCTVQIARYFKRGAS